MSLNQIIESVYIYIEESADEDAKRQMVTTNLDGLELNWATFKDEEEGKQLLAKLEANASQQREKRFLIVSSCCLTEMTSGRVQEDVGIGVEYHGTASYVIENLAEVEEEYLQMIGARKYKVPYIIAETSRLIIRELALSDLEALYELYDSVKECGFVEPLYDREKEEEFQRNYIEHMYRFYGYGLWLVFLKEGNQLVGRIGIENRMVDGEDIQEIGYVVNQHFQRKGIAQEACMAIIDYAREALYLDALYTCINAKNMPSIQLATKLGFTLYASDIDGMNLYRMNL